MKTPVSRKGILASLVRARSPVCVCQKREETCFTPEERGEKNIPPQRINSLARARGNSGKGRDDESVLSQLYSS